jgi:hypothetical protein
MEVDPSEIAGSKGEWIRMRNGKGPDDLPSGRQMPKDVAIADRVPEKEGGGETDRYRGDEFPLFHYPETAPVGGHQSTY